MNLPEEEWVLVKGESEGHPYFMMVNDGLKYFEGKADYCYCLIVKIELNEVQDHKLPTDDETEVLNQMEDILLNELALVTLPIEIVRGNIFRRARNSNIFPKTYRFQNYHR